MSHVWLSGRQPDGKTGEWALDQDDVIIGREAPAAIVLPLPRISRQHARLTRFHRSYLLTDLGSRNGTFVNGTPVGAEAVRLSDGDEIVLGGVVTLRFHDPDETVDGPRVGRVTGVWIDEASKDVWVDARRVEPPLSAAQLALLRLLYQRAGEVVSRADLIADVWPDADPAGVSEEAVDGLIKRLRARLRETQPEVEYVEVRRGHGLRLIPPAEDKPRGS
jgi:pSer/pThr/pTyr-binding forkhead associated (FHA) protein